MFFTDPSWQATIRIAGKAPSLTQKFHRWRLVGLPLNAPTFIVSPTDEEADIDTQALMVSDPDALIQLLQQTWPRSTPTVRVMGRGKIALMHELWLYSVGQWEGYAYKTGNGKLESCSPYQPDIPTEAEGTCIWSGRAGMLVTATRKAPPQSG
jgi:hypothetical protein